MKNNRHYFFNIKKLPALLLVLVIAVSSLFVTGCSEEDINTVIEIASEVIAERESRTAGQSTQKAEEKTTEQTKEEKTTKQAKEEKTTKKTQEEKTTVDKETTEEIGNSSILEDGDYYSAEDVAEYIHLYGHLPDNYLTKDEAYDLGWDPDEGNLWKVAKGACIGGDKFSNYEGELPKKKGRKYYECDVNYDGGYRGPERIVFSSDGLVYYTPDHYDTFELLYD